MSGLIGALSLPELEMKSFGFSGGGAEVGSNDGSVLALALGMSAVAGRSFGPFAVVSPLSALTTATATATPMPTVARAPPTIIRSLRRLLRISDCSASDAQSGVWLLVEFH